MKQAIVPNRVMRLQDGTTFDAPDAPLVYRVIRRNGDGTWTIDAEDQQQQGQN